MNDKTIKEKQRKSLDTSGQFANNQKANLAALKSGFEGHKRNLTISESFIKQRLGKTSTRNIVGSITIHVPNPEIQNTKKSNQKQGKPETNALGIKSCLSEKCLKLNPAQIPENSEKLKAEKTDKTSNQPFSTQHFLNPNYKNTDLSKHELVSRGNSRYQWTKSHLSGQKKENSSNHFKEEKGNNSVILAALNKGKQSSKLRHLLLDEPSYHLIETKGKKIPAKLSSGILLPTGLNIPNSPVKNKALFLNQHTLGHFIGKKLKVANVEKETKELNVKVNSPREINSPTSIIQEARNSTKKVLQIDAKMRDQNYFFNLKSLQKIKLSDKNRGLSKKSEVSKKSGIRSLMSGNQSSQEVCGENVDKNRKMQIAFQKKINPQSSCKKNIEKRNQSNKIHPGIIEQFPDLYTQRHLPNEDLKGKTAPKFQQILQNIHFEKETDDLKALKLTIKQQAKQNCKMPESDLSYYEIVKRIGEGSFGKVYLGLQKLTNRLVAIKRLEKATVKDEMTRKKILSEVNIQKIMFGHPNIVKLLEVFENKQFVYFVMEYAANGDLLKHLKQVKKCEEEDSRGIFFQIASGLRYIHHNGIIHRDIKLDNILIDECYHYKICDFGVGRYMKPHELINEQCGTPAYLAPEIVLEKGYKGFGADIWSLGVLLFCLLTGIMPFKGATLEKLNEQIVKGEFQFPKEVELSDEVKDLIRRMLVVDPENRMTIEEVLEHEWVKSVNMNRATFQNINQFEKKHFKYLSESEYKVNESALTFVTDLGFDRVAVCNSVMEKQMNHATACYFTIERDFT